MLKISQNEGEVETIHRAVYKFIKQGPCLRNGFSPLCCASTKYSVSKALRNLVTFPNISLGKSFIAYGNKVNVFDEKNSTPLHTIAECAEAINDVDST